MNGRWISSALKDTVARNLGRYCDVRKTSAVQNGYHPSLGRLQDALRVIVDLARPDIMASPHIRELWTTFLQRVHERLQVKVHFDSGHYVAARVCDNLACGKIEEKRMLSRCSNVITPIIVRGDASVWTGIPDGIANMFAPPQDPPRGPLNAAQFTTMNENPGETLLVAFDSHGTMGDRPIWELQPDSPLRAYYLRRAVESAGRMEFHVMIVRFGLGAFDTSSRCGHGIFVFEGVNGAIAGLTRLDVRTVH
ncbi:hypothetical protein DFH09DRAFT_1367528 [Mycena vulgaris]|nr:hypothetical protein DFH09DRAFT_1367528 [Mycena vulgaris]